ncbi:MAG: Hsp70 family protein, partial [Chitinophagales bacterium]
VLQGERQMAKDNRTIGRFMLDGIPPAPRGVPQVEVSFDIDANGILSVSAKDKGTGKEQTIKIQASTGLSKEEIEKMRKDAHENEAADKAEREKIDKLNTADALAFQTEKQLKEFGDKIPADKKNTIEVALNKLRDAHKIQDIAGIETASNELNTAWQAASEDLYKAQQQQPPNTPQDEANDTPPDGEAKNEHVEDVPFEEVKDDKS